MLTCCKRGARGAALLLCLSLGGCATAVFDEARSHYYAGDPVAGVAVLDKAAAEEGIPARDTLLLHLERGLMLYRAGLFAESAKAFLAASDFIEQHQKISVSGQAKTLLSNDWSTAYLGEYSEQLWTHSYAMMSFIRAGAPESAAVEARRALQALETHGESLDGALFSRALIALSFELAEQYNDAYVAYRQLHELLPDAASMAQATYRMAQRVGSESGESWREKVAPDLWTQYGLEGGEAILFISAGRGPRKHSGSIFYGSERLSFPSYELSSRASGSLRLSDGQGQPLAVQRVSTDMSSVAQRTLDARGKKVLAKALLRGRLKHELVNELRDDNAAAAEVLNLVFFLLEEADTRGWESLPARLSLVRVPLAPQQQILRVQLGEQSVELALDPDEQDLPQLFSVHF